MASKTTPQPATVLKKFFGLKPGQTNTEFLNEIKGLSLAERDEMVSQIHALDGEKPAVLSAA